MKFLFWEKKVKIYSCIPKTVEEAVDQILSGWSIEERKSFKELKPDDLFDLRNTLGSDIRNVFSLWYGNDELLYDCDLYLTKNYESYNQPFQIKTDLGISAGVVDKQEFIDDEENPLEEEKEDLLEPLCIEMFTKEPDVPIDPYIASQVIIFAVWKHLQGINRTL
jgi:hypothetical protein